MTGLELKELREAKGLTQLELAKIIGVTRKTINTYENSETIPKQKEKLFLFELGDNVTTTEALAVNFEELSVMFVPLVSKFAYAGYLNGYGDDEYVGDLPKIPFANGFEPKGKYLCFEVKGDSMDDGSHESILEGDIVLGRQVRQDYWKSKLHIHKWDFVIVHKEQGILVKRIIGHDVDNGIITLHSLNDYYEDFTVHLKDVAQIFNIVDLRRKKSRR